jgi:TatD DNase family protein
MNKTTSNSERLIDTCVNLSSREFNKDRNKVIQNSFDNNVYPLIITGYNLSVSNHAKKICEYDRNNLFFTVGIHPHDAGKNKNNFRKQILELAKDPNCVSIGECGLDYNRKFSSREDQIECFDRQIQIACDLQLPLFIHEREAHYDMIQTLKPYKDRLPQIVIHCFTGNLDEMRRYINIGFYIGLTGYICMEKRGKNMRENILPYIPLNRILLETDAPFMHPTSSYKNKKRTEPTNTIDVCQTIAEVLKIKYEDVAIQTTKNAELFFGLNKFSKICKYV